MNRRIKIVASTSIALMLLAALLAGTALAQGPTPTPRTPFGRWGGFGWGGMMGGWGHGGMMGGCGGWGGYPGTGTPLTLDEAIKAAQEYLAAYGNLDPSTGSRQALALTEVMEFTNNFYAEVEEESTGIHAFELLINRYTGAVYPEMGPNMMWNIKYGHMGGWHRGMMGGWGWGGYDWQVPTADMPVTAEQAIQYAQQFLDTYLPGTVADEEAKTFYGYYTIHVLREGQVYGMLSVNGYTGQGWYHTWHGDFIGIRELE